LAEKFERRKIICETKGGGKSEVGRKGRKAKFGERRTHFFEDKDKS
jgi:hypothetical protein